LILRKSLQRWLDLFLFIKDINSMPLKVFWFFDYNKKISSRIRDRCV